MLEFPRGPHRDFNNRERPAPLRNVEDAPQGMRQELIDRFFNLIEHLPLPNPQPRDQLHQVIGQSLGVQTAANPYGGFRYAEGVTSRALRGREYMTLFRAFGPNTIVLVSQMITWKVSIESSPDTARPGSFARMVDCMSLAGCSTTTS